MRSRSSFRNWTEYIAARLVLASLERIPRPFAESLARVYITVLDRAVPRLRRIALRNLKMAFPDLTSDQQGAVADGVYQSIARALVAFARFPRIDQRNIRKWIRYEGLEHFEEGIRKGKGVLFATAHLGNWELSAFAHALLTAPMHLVARPLDNPLIDGLVEHRRTLRGNKVIKKKDFARGILRALSNNEAVGILIDQNSSLDDGVFVDFFGVPACAGTGFAKIAAHSGATVVPGFALWDVKEQSYVLRFYPPVKISGDAAEDTIRLQKTLEDVIRHHPDQWLWIHRRWKTRPAGEQPLY